MTGPNDGVETANAVAQFFATLEPGDTARQPRAYQECAINGRGRKYARLCNLFLVGEVFSSVVAVRAPGCWPPAQALRSDACVLLEHE
jgi:hypothetical protein